MKTIFLSLLCICMLNSWPQAKTDNSIINWVRNYYQKSPYVKNNSDIHALLLEKISSREINCSIYVIGVNISGAPDRLLVYKAGNGNSSFTVIGDTDISDSLNKMYMFFKQNKAFSYKTRVTCYEKLIINNQGKHDYIK